LKNILIVGLRNLKNSSIYNNWADKLSIVIDLFDEIQKVLEKVDELKGSITTVKKYN
jgi:hypothetical protein